MTPDSGRRTPRMSATECERVASQRCPSGSRCWNLRKSQSPSTAGHLVVTARSRTQDHRWIRAKSPDWRRAHACGALTSRAARGGRPGSVLPGRQEAYCSCLDDERCSGEDREMGHEAPDRHPVELHWQDEEAEPLAARARPWRGWVALAGVVAVLVVVPSLVQRGTVLGPIEPQQPTPTPSSATTSRVVVPDLGPAILGVTDRWELFALGDTSVTQIQLAAGRITTTYFAPLQSTGPVFLVVGPDRAIVKPLDRVPGYVVPDTGPVRGLTGLLDRGATALPASDPNQVWVGPED